MQLLDEVAGDLRYAVRRLRKNIGYSSVAIITLALGIGANTAMFHLTDVVRLRTLAVSNPRELVRIQIPNGNGG